eukprot:TRINITY_DN2505_c0_g1_i2.p1 TRINITY_DN2505_c0_g1~~TRINITY_DN2505_c0_g1_i2.p1  ORF type:complete len:329 (+),score=61.21 TRINITY_DN2505_c0_g1_i2:145-1131(+)
MDIPFLSDPNVLSVLACVFYSGSSLLMTFVNKMLLSSSNVQVPLLLCLYQSLFTVVALGLGSAIGRLELPVLERRVLLRWAPVNVLFLTMMVSANYALQSVAVPMFTVVKNSAIVLVAIGDAVLFKQLLSPVLLLSMGLMVLGSLISASNDLEFSPIAYFFLGINVLVSSAYVLYLRSVVKSLPLSEIAMVYLNNLLSLVPLVPALYLSGELMRVHQAWLASDVVPARLIWLWLASGVLSLVIALATFWTVRLTSPTTFSFMGALNKIPLTILSFLVFRTPINGAGLASIVVGLSGGMLYSYEKNRIFKAAAASTLEMGSNGKKATTV